MHCPGCGAAIIAPSDYSPARDWLKPLAWCARCGGTAPKASK